MELFLQVLAALLIVAGLLGLGWLLFGKLVAPVGEEGRVFAVIPARGDAETLEHDVQGLLWLRGSDLAAFTVVIADYGLSDQGRILALLLQRREPGLLFCRPEGLGELLGRELPRGGETRLD